jgi:hypothetical protein
MTIVINGMEIDLRRCVHCGLQSTEEDAKAAAKMFTYPVCAICNLQVLLVGAYLEHSVYDGKSSWGLYGRYDDRLDIRQYMDPGLLEGTVHVRCLRRVAPGLSIYCR